MPYEESESSRRQKALRELPSVDALLRSGIALDLQERYGREAVVETARSLLDSLRGRISEGAEAPLSPESILSDLETRLRSAMEPGLVPVINATGVVIHTNLGRSPLSLEALEAVARTGGRYLNLELDLATGRRGRRAGRLEDHIRAVTGGEAAVVVNNNAAAVLLLLNTLGGGREVVVSRGELVEIGGSFRIPDVMAASGARMVEVGTTNRTRPSDYENACGGETALLLKVHRSNFQVVGFTEEPDLGDLVDTGRRREVPVAVDLGSGLLRRLGGGTLAEEPTVSEVLDAGVDAVTFSGDKALGGPQAGYIVGKRNVVEACRRNPMMRALRPGRLTLAAAEASWRQFRQGRDREIPTIRMLSLSSEELRSRAEAFARRLRTEAPRLRVELVEQDSRVGGGTAPGEDLPTSALSLALEDAAPHDLHERLRTGSPAVLARVHDGRLLLDLRTVLPQEEDDLASALAAMGGA